MFKCVAINKQIVWTWSYFEDCMDSRVNAVSSTLRSYLGCDAGTTCEPGLRVKLGMHNTVYWTICHYEANCNNKSSTSLSVYALYARSLGHQRCRLIGRACMRLAVWHQDIVPDHGYPLHGVYTLFPYSQLQGPRWWPQNRVVCTQL